METHFELINYLMVEHSLYIGKRAAKYWLINKHTGMLSKHIKYFLLLFGFQQIPINLNGTGFVPILSNDVIAKVSTW